MEFIEIAKTDEIPQGTAKAFKVNGEEILVANYNGSYFAISNKCTHMGGDLSRGKLDGSIVTCPRHGSQFDITTGKNLQGPKIGPFRGKAKDLKTYELKAEGNSLKLNKNM